MADAPEITLEEDALEAAERALWDTQFYSQGNACYAALEYGRKGAMRVAAEAAIRAYLAADPEHTALLADMERLHDSLTRETAVRLAAEERVAELDRRRRSLEAALRVARGYVLGGLALPVGMPRQTDIKTIDEALGIEADHFAGVGNMVPPPPTEASGSK